MNMNVNKDLKVDPDSTVEKDVALGTTHDIGADLYLEAEQLSPEELAAEGPKVLRIIDWRIMPMVRCSDSVMVDPSLISLQLYVTYVIQFLGMRPTCTSIACLFSCENTDSGQTNCHSTMRLRIPSSRTLASKVNGTHGLLLFSTSAIYSGLYQPVY